MKVVLGVDGSPSSRKAMDWVVHSLPSAERVVVVAAADSGIAMKDSMLVRHQREAAEEDVRNALQALAAFGARVTGRVVDGDPREVLVDVARTEGADLVVVGSRGRTGLTRLLLGSVASHVATHAPCSVLVVR